MTRQIVGGRMPPQNLDLSQIVDIELREARKGIILEEIDQVREALNLYAGLGTPSQFFDGVGEDHGQFAEALLLGINYANRSASDKEIGEMIKELKANGRFDNYFASQVFGSPFFGKLIKIESFRGGSFGMGYFNKRYLLFLGAHNGGGEEERAIAEQMNKTMALEKCRAALRLSPIQNDWFHIDLEDILKDLKLNREQISHLADSIAHAAQGYFEISHGKNQFRVKLEIPFSERYNNAGQDRLRARLGKSGMMKTAVVGPVSPEYLPEQPGSTTPTMIFSLSLKNRYDIELAKRPQEIRALYDARQYILDIIRLQNPLLMVSPK